MQAVAGHGVLPGPTIKQVKHTSCLRRHHCMLYTSLQCNVRADQPTMRCDASDSPHLLCVMVLPTCTGAPYLVNQHRKAAESREGTELSHAESVVATVDKTCPPCPDRYSAGEVGNFSWRAFLFERSIIAACSNVLVLQLAIQDRGLCDLGARCVGGCRCVVNTTQLTKRYSDALATCVPVTDCKPHCNAPHRQQKSQSKLMQHHAALAIHQCHTRRRPSAASPNLLQRQVFPPHRQRING